MRPRLVLLTACVLLVGSSFAHADSYTITIPNTNFNITAGSPSSFNVSGVPALTNFLGYSVGGNWSAVSGDPWSFEMRVTVVAPSYSLGPNIVGGVGNGNNFTFPGPSFGLANGVPTIGSSFGVANQTGGSYNIQFDQDFAGSVANLQNAAVTLYHNPTILADTTAGAPTYDRPEPDGSGLSGNLVQYRAYFASTTQAGRHMFAVDAAFDTFLSVYGPGGFNPASPLTNLIAVGDDSEFGLDSAFTLDLTTGTQFTVVVTGFGPTDFGAFTLYGAGPGTVNFSPVPEPTTMLGLSALAVLGGAGVRRWWKARTTA